MSIGLINEYLAEIDRLRRTSGMTTEQIVREAFKDLLKAWSKAEGLVFIAEMPVDSPQKTRVIPDGTILHEIRVPLGHWEAKDTADVLDEEIAKKLRRGYPQDNILFENTETAILIQNRSEVLRCDMQNVEALNRLLRLFFSYERPEVGEFRKAVERFKSDLPAVLAALRGRIDEAYAANPAFTAKAAEFLAHAKTTINPTLGEADVREMLIQHILTEDIFNRVFGNADFHRDNNIAQALYELERLFLGGGRKQELLAALRPFYSAIFASAEAITGHGEKQKFLKLIYENFYKVYNPDAADRLGVVYTPNEIVQFIIRGADWLCREHFGKGLIDRGVEILDPATGTGTFICELIESFRGQPEKLSWKYREELHANEVAILPYYVANLNIEATYAAVSGQYAEFRNLCFVDTLDNVAGLGIKSGETPDLFAAFSDENVERVNRQNRRKISVVIGNPPYNANQQNENDNNRNRAYPHIDGLIKRSFVKLSTAQKTKVYDMYSRFFRWAADRLHDEGVIAFVTNSSFVDSRTFDGFRRFCAETFNEVHIIDLKGNARTSGERRRREGGNVFDDKIKVGIAVSFFVKNPKRKGFKVFYDFAPDYAKSDDKLTFLTLTPLERRKMRQLTPDKNANWIDQPTEGWEALLPVADKATKAAKRGGADRAIFRLFSLGVSTNRDEWIYDLSREVLIQKSTLFSDTFNEAMNKGDSFPESLKSSSTLLRKFEQRRSVKFKEEQIINSLYRPFYKSFLSLNLDLIDRPGSAGAIISTSGDHNPIICFTVGGRLEFDAFASGCLPNLTVLSLDANQCLPRYRYTPDGERLDNITDWALNKFVAHYGKAAKITKDDIFHYVYAVLHDPVYRETYALNLRREFPRIPFYPDFPLWRDWGARLMNFHVNYEAVPPLPLTRRDTPDEKARAAGLAPRPILKSDPAAGTITLDSETRLEGVPPVAWEYRLGNRSAIDWVLDQHKERRPKDPTIREKFDTYRFVNHKERVAGLLARVAAVSVETVAITEAMRALPAAARPRP